MPIVVIADDENDVAAFLRVAFRLASFEAYSVNNLQDCIEIIKKIGVDNVDVAVMNGRMASDRSTMMIVNIKKLSKDIKIFVVAERYLDETKTRVLDYGANEFVLKPISIQSIVEKVNTLLLETVTNDDRRTENKLL
jgi:DNA-binding response OmpR family regulator